MLDDLTAELPAPRDDEPPELRTRIVKELRDHLQCAYQQELLRAGDETEATRRVLAKFGDPAKLVKKLWFDAMWGKIMSQRALAGICGVMIAACVGLGAITLNVASNATKATQAVLEQSRAANQALLEQGRALQQSLTAKADSRPVDPEWVHLKIKLTKDSADGPPADGYLIKLAGGSATNKLDLNEKSGRDGRLDCGLVRAGMYHITVETTWNERTERKVYVRAGQPESVIAVVCPGASRPRFEAEINWPSDLKQMPDLGVVLSIRQPSRRDVEGETWDVTPGRHYADYLVRRYLVKTDGSIWPAADNQGAQSQLGDFEKGGRLSLRWFQESPLTTLKLSGPDAQYLLHGVAITPPGSNPPDDNLVRFVRNENKEWGAAQIEGKPEGAQRVRISLPEELLVRVRERLAKLMETGDAEATASLVAAVAVASDQKEKPERPKSYPISLNANEVREFAPLSIKHGGLHLWSSEVSGIPISCEAGVTGMVLIGNGSFRFVPEGGDAIEGHFRAAMLRFNPKDQREILAFDKIPAITDRAVHEMSNHLLKEAFRHCWHSGMEALIPEEGSLSVVLYSKEHGDLLISSGSKDTIVHSFTDRKTLYKKGSN